MDTTHIEFLSFSTNIIWSGLLLALLFVISALVSGSEAAFFSLNHHDTDRLKRSNSRSALAAITLMGSIDYLLATILIVNNLINIAAVIVASNLIDSIVAFGNAHILQFVVKTVIVTFLLLLFGEILPKIAATYNPYKFVNLISTPILLLSKILKPISYLLIRSSSHINEAASKKKSISMDELSDALQIATTQTAEDKKMLTGIVRFVNTEVSEIMRNRVDVVAIDINDSFAKVKQTIISSGFSRIPVYEDDIDNIKGLIYVKDLITCFNEQEYNWQPLLRQPYYVPEHKKINDLLEEFQSNHVHLAIAVDEYGSTQGVVSLEDILEEIVGEISDESDTDEKFYTKIDKDTYIFDGKTHTTTFLRVFDLKNDYFDAVKGDAETIAGILLEIKKEFLKNGEEVRVGSFLFKVISLDNHRINEIKVTYKNV